MHPDLHPACSSGIGLLSISRSCRHSPGNQCVQSQCGWHELTWTPSARFPGIQLRLAGRERGQGCLSTGLGFHQQLEERSVRASLAAASLSSVYPSCECQLEGIRVSRDVIQLLECLALHEALGSVPSSTENRAWSCATVILVVGIQEYQMFRVIFTT